MFIQLQSLSLLHLWRGCKNSSVRYCVTCFMKLQLDIIVIPPTQNRSLLLRLKISLSPWQHPHCFTPASARAQTPDSMLCRPKSSFGKKAPLLPFPIQPLFFFFFFNNQLILLLILPLGRHNPLRFVSPLYTDDTRSVSH